MIRQPVVPRLPVYFVHSSKVLVAIATVVLRLLLLYSKFQVLQEFTLLGPHAKHNREHFSTRRRQTCYLCSPISKGNTASLHLYSRSHGVIPTFQTRSCIAHRLCATPCEAILAALIAFACNTVMDKILKSVTEEYGKMSTEDKAKAQNLVSSVTGVKIGGAGRTSASTGTTTGSVYNSMPEGSAFDKAEASSYGAGVGPDDEDTTTTTSYSAGAELTETEDQTTTTSASAKFGSDAARMEEDDTVPNTGRVGPTGDDDTVPSTSYGASRRSGQTEEEDDTMPSAGYGGSGRTGRSGDDDENDAADAGSERTEVGALSSMTTSSASGASGVTRRRTSDEHDTVDADIGSGVATQVDDDDSRTPGARYGETTSAGSGFGDSHGRKETTGATSGRTTTGSGYDPSSLTSGRAGNHRGDATARYGASEGTGFDASAAVGRGTRGSGGRVTEADEE
jgi:hypothetical protein